MTARGENRWQTIISSIDGVRPNTTMGASVAAGASNAYGSYASILAGASLTQDCYFVEIVLWMANAAATDRGVIVTIGLDAAGGTSFTDKISHLLVSGSPAAWYNNGVPFFGHRFRFPIFIAAGTSIGFKCQASDASPPTMRAAVTCFCQPTKPWLVRCGTDVETLGITTASTTGVVITPGTTSEGTYTNIGTLAGADGWWIETAVGAKGAVLNNSMNHVDVATGTAGTKRPVNLDGYCLMDNSERMFKSTVFGDYCAIANGEHAYVRAQASGAGTDTIEAACYVVSGRRVIPTSASFTIAGTVTIGGAPAANGKTVQIFARDPAGCIELVAEPVTAGGAGGFTVDTYEGTRTYFARYVDGTDRGSSADGTPESSTFDITIGGASDVTAPTVTIVSPTPGVAPGAPGGFSSDWAIARMTPIVIDITDAVALRYQAVVCQYPGAANEITVYRRGTFRGEFAALSSEAAIANGKRLTILPASGWPSSDVLNDVVFEVDVIDTSGNLAA